MYDGSGQVVRTITGSAWTGEDRALMLAYQTYLDGLCRCGQPTEKAWHPDNDGWYEVADHSPVCHACTAIQRHQHPDVDGLEPVSFPLVVDTRPYDVKPLPELVLPKSRAKTAGRAARHAAGSPAPSPAAASAPSSGGQPSAMPLS